MAADISPFAPPVQLHRDDMPCDTRCKVKAGLYPGLVALSILSALLVSLT